MGYVVEHSENLGRVARLVDLRDAIDAMDERGANMDSRVSFRERNGDMTLVARWEQQDCEACGDDATWINENGYAFCADHTDENFPALNADGETLRNCGQCEIEATIRIGDDHFCETHWKSRAEAASAM